MKRDEYRVYRDAATQDWFYDYADCPQAEPRGPYNDRYDAERVAASDPGPTPSDYLL